MIDLNSGQPWETVTLTALGRNRQIFFNLLNDARDIALQKEEGKTVIYTSMGLEWRQFGHPRSKRPIESVILDDNKANDIKHDIEDFYHQNHIYGIKNVVYLIVEVIYYMVHLVVVKLVLYKL